MPSPSPLHVRSGYSMCRGTALPGRIIERAIELGHRRIAMTDVNNLYGATVFWKQATSAGLEPIIGAELTLPKCSVVALCENLQGYEHLCRIITRIHDPRHESSLGDDLAELGEGLELLVESASSARELHHLGLGDRLWAAMDPFTQSAGRMRELLDCAHELNIPPVASGKALLVERDDMPTAELLAAIRTGGTLSRLDRVEVPPADAFLRSGDAIARALSPIAPEACANNHRLAERCAGFKLLPRRPVFPDYPCPDGQSAPAHLLDLCQAGLEKRYSSDLMPRAIERMRTELSVIEKMGFCEYFLVVRDIVQYARRRGAPVAGRGSGASSIVAYSLGITNVCPLRYDIPFERFLHEGREDFPDLDVDFCWRMRDEVIDYAFKRWGSDHVAMVSMHGTFQPRSALRETAKAMGYSNSLISQMDEFGASSDKIHAPEPVKRLARRLLSLPHNLSVHPGGIVIGMKTIDHYVPIQPAPKGVNITQYDKDGVEDIRLVKLDLLGNRNLSTVRYAADLIQSRGHSIDIESLPDDDPDTIDLLQRADTVGCNQLESPAMRHLLLMMRPNSAGDVMKALAMIRPGAAGIGMKETFIRRMRGLEPVPAPPARLEWVLDDTYGIMLYEDDVMRVAAAMLGTDLASADRFRKAVQKCRDDQARIELSRDFLAGCRRNGMDLEYARSMWVQMAKFNAYSFCRAHAASYGLLAYAGAYLRAHYPLEFWVSALNNNQSMYPTRVYVEQAKREGVGFLLPDINRSTEEFSIDGNAVRIGLDCVCGLGPAAVEEIIDVRKARPFGGLSDFLYRTGIGETQARSLVLCGAFDWSGRTRPMLMMELNLFHRIGPRRPNRGGTLVPVAPTLPEAPGDYTHHRKYLDERAILGLTPGPHILTLWRRGRPDMAKMTNTDSRRLWDNIGEYVRIAGMLEARRSTSTDRGEPMHFVTLEDEWGLFEASIFPRASRRVDTSFTRHGPYIVAGKVENQYGSITINATEISPLV